MDMTKARIESDSLNEMWQKWLRHRFPSQIDQLRWSDHIDRVNLKYGRGKDFDEFVWSCGGHIRQQNGKRYLEFFNDEDAIMFTLRWA
jgi:hypothetical protein